MGGIFHTAMDKRSDHPVRSYFAHAPAAEFVDISLRDAV